MSDILWEITATWANKGRQGDTQTIVVARDAIAALQLFWEPEDPLDLRDVKIKWLGPVECVTCSGSARVEVSDE